MKDVDVNMVAVSPALEKFAAALDAYGLMLSRWTNYHAGPNDGDVTDFAIAVPSTSRLLKSVHYVAHIDSVRRHPVVYRVRNLRGKMLRHKPWLKVYLCRLWWWGKRLERLGIPRAQLGEYLSLITTWDAQAETHTSQANVIKVLRLPLDVFDRRQVLAHGAHLLPELERYTMMAPDVLVELFQLERLREQERTYVLLRKRGLIGKIS